MFRTIKFYIKALGAVIALVPLRFKAKLILRAKGRKAADEYIYKVVHWWAGGRVRDTGANVIVHNPENLPKDGNYLFTCPLFQGFQRGNCEAGYCLPGKH